MERFRLFFAALCLTFSADALATVAGFDDIWVFGDSYSDRQNAQLSTQFQFGVPLLSGDWKYNDGRFTDGEYWLEGLVPSLNLPAPLPGFNLDGTIGNNLAFGGAKTGTGNTFGATAEGSGLTSQLNDGFLQSYSDPATNGNDLFVVFGGANDTVDWSLVNRTDNGLRDSVAANAVSNIDNIVRTLYGVGARDFLMPNLPGYTVFDDVNPFPQDSLAFATAFNPLLAQQIQTLRNDLPQATIIEVDFFALFENMVANPGDYGLTNVTAPCLDVTFAAIGFGFQDVCGNPAEYLMFDTLHPSSTAHAAMGEAALAALTAVPVPGAIILILPALFGLGIVGRRRRVSEK